MNKLEKVAIRYARKNGRPLVLAFNSMCYYTPGSRAEVQISTCSQIHPRVMGCYISSRPVQRLGRKV